MSSFFYRYTFKKRFPVTFLFLELFANSARNSESGDISNAIKPVLLALGHKPPYSDTLLSEIIEDMLEVKAQHEKTRPTKKSSPNQRGMASELMKWVAGLEVQSLLLVLCDYDFERASKLYCETPALVVGRMIELRSEQEWHRAQAVFDAVVFGTGGKMKGGSSENVKIMDAATAEKKAEMEQGLKRLGFM